MLDTEQLASTADYKTDFICTVQCYTPISIKVALGIMLWSLKAIVWWSLKKALHCILHFNDQIPKQTLLK